MISFDADVAAAAISFLTLLALIGGGFFWLGKLGNRVGQLESRIGQMEDRVGQIETKVDRLEVKVDQIETKVDQIAEELRNFREEMREEIRRSNQQILLALVNHPHDADGQPVFRVPVSPE